MRAYLSPSICTVCGGGVLNLLVLVYNRHGDSGSWVIEDTVRLGGETVTNSSRTFMFIDKERFVPWLKKAKDDLVRKAGADVREAEFCAGQVQLIETILSGSESGLWDWQPAE